MQARAVAAAFGEIPVHPSLVWSFHWTLGFANEMLITKQVLFPFDEPQLDYVRMLEEAARTASEVPAQYDLAIADCRAVAEKNGLDFDESHLLPREPLAKPPRRDRREVQSNTVFIELDGAARGLKNVFDAIAALASELPPVTAPKFVMDAEPVRAIAGSGDQSVMLDFSLGGNGALLLGRGWSVIEPWGVWSIGGRAELTFPFERNFSGSVVLRLIGSVFLPPRTMTISLKVGSRLRLQRELDVTEPRVDIELPSIEIEGSASTEKLELIIGISEAQTPMEAGVCLDPRRIGFGLERMVIRMARRPQSRLAAASRIFRRMVSGVREPTV
jgi:hypothetical protein